jgi:hypothetical protein
MVFQVDEASGIPIARIDVFCSRHNGIGHTQCSGINADVHKLI